MLRTIFGKKDEGQSVPMSSSISTAEFKDALNRYPTVLSGLNKPAKDGALSLDELDKFRYQVAPMNFSKNTGRQLELSDVKKLLEWKMRHGTFRPALGSKVASNSNEKIAAATKDAFAYYAENKQDLKGVLEKLTTPLKGIGPATGSLILAIHDPASVIYFSDELYRWLVADGKKVKLVYSIKEYEELASKAKTFMSRINCTPIELEKVAFTIIKENEPVIEPKPKKVPSGLPRGRPAKPESEKKTKKPSSGLPRGRPRKETNCEVATPKRKIAVPNSVKASAAASGEKKRGRPAKTEAATPASGEKKRGRPAKSPAATPASGEKKRGRPAKSAAATPASGEKKRGRPAKSAAATPASGELKKRGRPAKVEELDTPATGSKRKSPESLMSSSPKRAKK